MSRLTCALALVIAATVAHANGRAPAAQSISFRVGNPQHVVVGATFGALTSTDGGATWHWTCEAAVGYGGIYDPDYAYSSSGAIFATTAVNGMRINRDGCTYAATTLGSAHVAQVELTSSLAHVAVADPANASIYTSSNDGVSYPTVAMPGLAGDWWQSLRVAPSDATRLYVAGYRIVDGTKSFLLYTSTNGGTSFTAMATTGLALSQSSVVSIVGVAATAPQTVYALVTFDNGTATDALYVSTNAGTTWAPILSGTQIRAFVARSNGELVAASPSLMRVSQNGGTSWSVLANAPTTHCLVEQTGGTVWACTSMFANDYVLMKSTDLTTWTGVLRLPEIDAPVDCAAGTVQHDTCLPQWCFLRTQLGITADPTGCVPQPDGVFDGLIDAAISTDAGEPPPPRGGCCDGAGQATSSLAILFVMCVVRCRTRSRHPQSRRRALRSR